MARGGVSFRDPDVKSFTFKLATGITANDEGKAVAVADEQTAGLGNNGDMLLGKLSKVEGDGYGTVDIAGILYLSYAAAAVPTVGSAVVVDGAGNIKNDPGHAAPASGQTAVSKGRGLVIDVDTTNKLAAVIL
jgi:hypothetical protein